MSTLNPRAPLPRAAPETPETARICGRLLDLLV